MRRLRSRDMKGFAPGPQAVTVEAGLSQVLLSPVPGALPWYLPSCQDIPCKHFGICPPWDPVFLSEATSGRRDESLWHARVPHCSERTFVPSSIDIPQACSRQIHLPAGHNPWLGRYFGLFAFKCTCCYLGSWSQAREARQRRPRSQGRVGHRTREVCWADLAWEENHADYLPGPAAETP